MDKDFHFDLCTAVGTRAAGFTAPSALAVGEFSLDDKVFRFHAESEVRGIFYIGFYLKERRFSR